MAVDIALVPFFIWRIWINNYPSGIPFWQWAFNGDKIRFRPSFWRWIFGERLGHLILGSWGLIPFSFGLLKSKGKIYLIHSFLLGMFLYVVVIATANVRHDYYQIIVIPAVTMMLAQGTLSLWGFAQAKQWLARGALIFSLAMMFLVSATQVRELYKINHPEIIRAGAAVDRIAPKEAKVIAPYNGDTAFLYATNRRGWPAVDSSIDNIIEKGADYYVSVDLASADTLQFSKMFATLKKTDKFIILDLHKRLKK